MATEADELPITIEEGCVVLQDTEYWVPTGATVGTVGALVSFLELQDDFLGKKVIPYSAKRRKIVTKDVASSMVAYVKVEGGGNDTVGSQFLPTIDPDAQLRAEEEALAAEEDELLRQEADMRREQERQAAAKPKGMLKVMRSADDFAPKEEDPITRDRTMTSLLTDLQGPAVPVVKAAAAKPWHEKALSSYSSGKPSAPTPAPTQPAKPVATAAVPKLTAAAPKPKAVALPPPPLVSSPKVELPPAQPKIAPPQAFPVPISKQDPAKPAAGAAAASTGSVLADAIRSRAQTAKAEKAAAKAAAPGNSYFPGLRKVEAPVKTSPFGKSKPAAESEEPVEEPIAEEPVDEGQDALDSLDDLIVETKKSPAPASPKANGKKAAVVAAAVQPVVKPAGKKSAPKNEPSRFTMMLQQLSAGDEPMTSAEGDEAISELDDLLGEKTQDMEDEEQRLEEERRALEDEERKLEEEEAERERERQEREEKERQRILAEESARAKQLLIAKAKGIKPPEVKKAAAKPVATPAPKPVAKQANGTGSSISRDSDTTVAVVQKKAAAATPPPKPYSSDTDVPKKVGSVIHKPPAPEELQYTIAELEADPSICFTCEKKIDETDSDMEEPLRACDRLWHKECWLCFECKKTLFGEKFGSDGPRVYCEEDFKRKFFCATCEDFIEDEISERDGKAYHPHCLPVPKPASGKSPEEEEEYKKWMDEFRNRSAQKQAETAAAAAAPPETEPVVVKQVSKPQPKMTATAKPPAHLMAATGPKPALIPIQPKPAAMIPIASPPSRMVPGNDDPSGNRSPRPAGPSGSNVLTASKPTNQSFRLDLSKTYTFTITNKVMVSLAAKGDPYGYQVNIWDPSVLGGPSTIVRQYKDMETLYERLKPLNKKTPQLPKLSKKWKVGEELNELQTWLISISRMEGIYRTEAMRAFMEGLDISTKGPPGGAGVNVGAPIAVRHVSHVTADDLRGNGPKYP